MRSPRLDRRLFAVLLAVLVPLALAGVATTLYSSTSYLAEVDQRLHRELAATLAQKAPLLTAGEVQRESLQSLFMQAMAVNPRIEIYLLDAAGRILAFDAPPGRVKTDHVALAPIERFLNGAKLPLRGDDPRHPGVGQVFSVAPVLDADGSPAGYLYVVLGGEAYDSVLERVRASYALRSAVIVTALSVVVAAVIGLWWFHRLTRRLRRLDADIERFAATGFQAVPAPGLPDGAEADEIDRLAVRFRELSLRVVQQMAELRQVDHLRRELVANVSHDLRTPLASLRGYLETLLLEDDRLPVAERREYLAVAVAQAERLGKLIGDLFELAKLDSGAVHLDLEPFNLAELAQDLAQKYRLRAAERQIELVAELPPPLPPVVADLRLIERVLENLLDNALRFTGAGGEVRVVLEGRPQAVRVRVSDTGTGIAEPDLARVFDRFYRGKGEPGSKGAGLGLAIARRALELHGSTIEVSSTPGCGSTFSFELAARPA